ncbi:glutathione S-transferase [Trichodelitschia bisporula]|uniref:Glutathione S-transferase n=1 Tax=Trichodelitschia bisporula TaxID=703511 RepID=A0A6G1HK87_9PEZI|nr:glutathione S-transferase [Trichodelitschia bisporula]
MAFPAPNQKAKVTLHWLNKSRAQRIVWLLEELKIDYDLKVYKRLPSMFAPPALKKVHPLGKSPVIEIQAEGAEPKVIAESALIAEYLAEYFGPSLIPARYAPGKEGQIGGETEEWLRYKFFMNYAEGSLMPLNLIALIMNQLKSPRIPFLIRPISKIIAGQVESGFLKSNYKTHLQYLESLLTGTDSEEFLCGPNLTVADILMVFPLEGAQDRAEFGDLYPKLAAYIKRIKEREAYKSAVEKAKRAESATTEHISGSL